MIRYKTGIYLLRFGKDLIYVGQSVNIPKRFAEHIRLLTTGKHTPKLLLAFSSLGLPTLEILCICTQDLLDTYENIYIKYLDSYLHGLNTLEHAEDMPKSDNVGTKHGMSKYSEDQLLKVLDLLVAVPIFSYEDIAKVTGVHYQTIANIASLSRHSTWMQERSPEIYAKLEAMKGSRNIGREVNTAALKGIKYPDIISPGGVRYGSINNVSKFMREHNITSRRFYDLLNGKETKIMGWTIA